MKRFAVYFAPDRDSAFWRFGCAWLGRDPETGAEPPRPDMPGLAGVNLEALTASPRNYGFHATLKPPFRLAPGCDESDLIAAAEAFAVSRAPFVCPAVAPAALGRFIAFRLTADAPEMTALAADAVKAFEPFRGPQTEAELAKRRAAGLSEIEEANLQAWGYPYVMDAFRFHMTLTGAIADDALRDRVAASVLAAADAAGAVGPMAVNGVALYEQPAPGAPFTLFRRLPFGG